MANYTVTGEIKNIKEITDYLLSYKKKGEKAMQRTASDLKKRLPGPIAKEVAKFYNIDKAEINPNSTKATPGKSAVDIEVKGNTVATLALIYEGRVLTPYGHGFVLKENKRKKKPSQIKLKVKKGKEQTLKGRYGTAFMAPIKSGSDVRIPFQRVPSTNKIEAIRTVAVPEMIDNEKVNAAIYERVAKIVNDRVAHNFKEFISK